MNGDGLEERSAGTERGSQARPLRIAGVVGVALLVAALAPESATGGGSGGGGGGSGGGGGGCGGGGAAAACPTPARPPRYPDVQPVFEQHCAKCHDARKARNDAAQAVFEMTSYPFSTRRPATLVGDLLAVFPKRGSLSAEEKCRGVQWLSAGALDADGSPPRWR